MRPVSRTFLRLRFCIWAKSWLLLAMISRSAQWQSAQIRIKWVHWNRCICMTKFQILICITLKRLFMTLPPRHSNPWCSGSISVVCPKSSDSVICCPMITKSSHFGMPAAVRSFRQWSIIVWPMVNVWGGSRLIPKKPKPLLLWWKPAWSRTNTKGKHLVWSPC